MNNLDIVLALFTTPNHRFLRLDTTTSFQAATSATSNWLQQNTSYNHKTQFNFHDCTKCIRLIIYDELSLLPFIIIWRSLFWPSSSRCGPKIDPDVAKRRMIFGFNQNKPDVLRNILQICDVVARGFYIYFTKSPFWVGCVDYLISYVEYS
jgi:hypothetical protein